MPVQGSHPASVAFLLTEGAFQPSAGLMANVVYHVSKTQQLHLSQLNFKVLLTLLTASLSSGVSCLST